MKTLTEREIRSAKPRLSPSGKPVKYELTDSTRERGVGRLVVRVSASGSKEFAYKYKVAGKVSYIQLGRFPALTLSQAREAIKPLINILKEGKDPKAERQNEQRQREALEQAESMKGSIQQLFKGYTDKMKADGKRTYEQVLKSLEKEVYPFILVDTKAKDVQPTDVVNVLAAMIDRGAATQSNRVRSYLVAAFNYGLKHDLDPAVASTGVKFGLTMNPAQVVPRQASAERVGNNWLNFNEVREVLADFHNTPRVGQQLSTLVKLCFLTGGQRPYELSASQWESVNWEDRTLLITEDLSKNKREHLVPLTDEAIELLSELRNQSKNSVFIFPQHTDPTKHVRTDSLSTAISRYREAKPEFKHFVARDIRRTCKTLMGELGVSKEIRDRLQNHALNDVSSKHYDRYDYLQEKRHALNIWQTKLNEVAQVSNVVELAREA
ncbi:tyrosine-type recombinase/integrase [Vibrio mediterranei]|uniref:tyrosine-type recombinase/integrase n=1 Tax=Vibrio mediterranei TaxID=689 RepID=UPI0040686D40